MIFIGERINATRKKIADALRARDKAFIQKEARIQMEAGADYLVSEDNHLLEIGKYQGVKIVEPGQFWAIYSEIVDGDPWQKWIRQFSVK